MANLESDAFVFFGATGDLASKQIFPPLQAMIRHGHLDIPMRSTAAWTPGRSRCFRLTFEPENDCLSPRPRYWFNSSDPRRPCSIQSPQGEGDYYRFRLSPNVSISLGARTKKTGEAMVGEPVELVVRQAPGDEMTPYERLLGDAIRGDATLFVRQDSVEAAWSVVGPVLGNAMPFMNTNQTPGDQPELTRSLPVMEAGTIPSQRKRQRKDLQNDARE